MAGNNIDALDGGVEDTPAASKGGFSGFASFGDVLGGAGDEEEEDFGGLMVSAYCSSSSKTSGIAVGAFNTMGNWSRSTIVLIRSLRRPCCGEFLHFCLDSLHSRC